MAPDFALRPATEADRDFLLGLYASTREEELSVVDWAPEQKHAFLAMQFQAQDVHYREHYPGAELSILLRGGVPAGRFYVHRRGREIRLMDIALLPEHRNQGIATELIGRLFVEAAATGKSVTVHVEQFNPALRLYERLGFRSIAEHGAYFLMEWTPPGVESSQVKMTS
jgi:ribosomal protein S18 acetylase RimI-like enzyme